MKKRKFLVILIIIILSLIPFWSWLQWRLQDDKVIRIVIADKTVNMPERNEHRSFNWILTHYRYVKPDHELYSILDDYYGFFPVKPYRKKKFEIHDFEKFSFEKLDTLSWNTDMVYYTDTYGVYRNEWYWDSLETEHSPKIYGGMTPKELYFLTNMKAQNKLILTEFNDIGSPTGYSTRKKFEETFDIKWSGWTGRYFDMLDTIRNPELPRWVIRLYIAQHGPWKFTRSGLVFVHEDSRLFILENTTHMYLDVPIIHTEKSSQLEYNLPDTVTYPFWIDVTQSGKSNKVIANYQLYPNRKGDSILRAYNVPRSFPCVIEHKKPYIFYYFAGDFADNPVKNNTCYFKGIRTIDYFLFEEGLNNRGRFFYKFYIPLITKIMSDYQEKLELNLDKQTDTLPSYHTVPL
jgi:hypothetical protein